MDQSQHHNIYFLYLWRLHFAEMWALEKSRDYDIFFIALHGSRFYGETVLSLQVSEKCLKLQELFCTC